MTTSISKLTSFSELEPWDLGDFEQITADCQWNGEVVQVHVSPDSGEVGELSLLRTIIVICQTPLELQMLKKHVRKARARFDQ